MDNQRRSQSRSSVQKQHSDSGRTGNSPLRHRSASNSSHNPRGGGYAAGPGKDNRSLSRNSSNPGRAATVPAKKGKAPISTAPLTSDLQVTDGKLRGQFLKPSASPHERSTPRRVRELAFRVLSRRVIGSRFLDLCSGRGTMAVEAISRGAMLGTCVERSARMCTVLKGNMELCGIKDGHFEIAEAEMVPFLKSAARRRRRWDVVFLDPPADSDYDEPLSYLGRGTAVRQGGAVLIEHPAEMFFPDRIGVLKRFRVVTADGTAVSFYERR